MMSRLWAGLALWTLLAGGAAGMWFPHNLNLVGHGVNGGADCAACTLIVNLFSQYHEYHKIAPMDAMRKVCSFWPTPLKEGCNLIVDVEGPTIAKLISKGESPDVVCHSMNDPPCVTQTEMCHLFPTKFNEREFAEHIKNTREEFGFDLEAGRTVEDPFAEMEATSDPLSLKVNKGGWFCKFFGPICKIIDGFSDEHKPVEDIDGDGFSTIPTLRGTDWRGKDCDDADKKVYPGRKGEKDLLVDTNCNGISGFDVGGSYEDQWCKDTQAMGTLNFGDSASAHFHLPPNWFNITEVNSESYKYMLFAIENELDWPMLSMHTGHFNATRWVPTINGPMHSTYTGMLANNLCNHRDYQNIGVNGASSRNINKFAKYFSRNHETDKPILMTLALIGNDVCDSSTKISRMTAPKEYYDKMKEVIQMADKRVPKGSHMVTIGLVDGRILWDSMHARIHPVGALKGDVTYKDLYGYLNCLATSPCAGWMNKNETIRNDTSAHARLLTKTLGDLVKDLQGNLTNIKLHDFGNAISTYINEWKKSGKPTWEIIEPMDGFHPNQIGNAFVGHKLFEQIKTLGFVPPANPHNSKIKEKFGDQGGY